VAVQGVRSAQHDALNAVYPAFDSSPTTISGRGRTRSRPPRRLRARSSSPSIPPAGRMSTPCWRSTWAACPTALPRRPASSWGGEPRQRSSLPGWETATTSKASTRSRRGPASTRRPHRFVLQPGFRFARPFALASADAFRPKGPPALDSRRYAAAFREVRETGRVDSSTRTADQTAYAVWWMEFVEGSINRLARRLVDSDSSAWDAARLFAQLNMGIFDSYLAVWDSKFEFNHWRPYTAIRAAAVDGNPRTAADPTWEPLRTTPPFPEYVSAHSAVCGSRFEILSKAFGRHTPFAMDTTTAPPNMPTRTFRSFSAAADECADSRVRLGFHFRYATDAGKQIGRRVARYLLERTSGHANGDPPHLRATVCYVRSETARRSASSSAPRTSRHAPGRSPRRPIPA
jgi:hypothetical protein